MTDAATPTQYDAFLSYAPADAAWVEGWLLPRLREAQLRLGTAIDFALGVPRLLNVERMTAASRHTVCVLSPAWLESEWSIFAELLTQSADPAGLRGRTIPLLLRPCQAPPRLSMLEPADFSGPEERWEIQLQRVIAALRPALAPAAPAELDADTIPPVAALPTGSRMPFARNPLFTGRAEELKALARALLFGSTGTAAIAATGLGGIGKSNLATEFVHRYGQFFPGGVFWLSFGDPANALAEVAALLQTQGEYAAARPVLERALAIAETSLGPEHPITAIRLNNLGMLLWKEGDNAAARSLLERALRIFVERLGVNHPNTAIVRENLAALDRLLSAEKEQ